MLPPILCISNMAWDAPIPTNRQQLMRRFARRTPVAVLEAPLPVVGSYVGQSRTRRRQRGWRRDGEVQVFQAWDWLPYPLTRRSRWLSRLADETLRRVWMAEWRRLGWEAPILWLYAPNAGDLLSLVEHRLALYHCVDDYAAQQRYVGYRRGVATSEEQSEAYLARSVDLVVVTSPHLQQRWQTVNTRTALLPNVADTEVFRQALEPGPEHPTLAGIPSPRVGYIGALDRYKLDLDLLGQVADRCSELQFVCVGPIGAGDGTPRGALPTRSNIHYLGYRPQAELPAILRGCAAAVIPYNLNDYTAGVSPLKLYEYLAAGCPVVATPLPALFAAQAEGLSIAPSTPAAFSVSLRQAVAIPAEARVRISRAASEHSWDRRVDELDALLSERLRMQDGPTRDPTARLISQQAIDAPRRG